jgi:uncharacterized alkaline shock family protein YloU
MTFLHGVVRFLMVVVTGTMGGLLLSGSLYGSRWPLVVSILNESEVRLCLGVSLLSLVLLFLLTGLARKKRVRFLSFENDQGVVSISTAAIEDYIGKLDKDFPSIIAMKIRVIPLRASIDVEVDLRLKAGPQIHEVCQVLQQRIRESLSTGLGISAVNRVQVNVREISTEHRTE